MERIVENGVVVFVSQRGINYENFDVRRGFTSARKLSQKVLLHLSSSSSKPEPAAEGPASPTQPRPGGGDGGGGRSNSAGTTFETLDPNVVIILVVLLFALVCAAFLNSIMRCVMRRSSRAEDPPQESQALQGLDAKALAVLPILSFRATQIEVVRDGSPAECPICLSEFTENKKVRLLPKCNHVFHIDCIDMWLLSHVSCPVCRDRIVDDPKLPSSAIVVVEEPSNSPDAPMPPAPSNMRAELLRESASSSSSALMIQTSALGGNASTSSSSQDAIAGSRRHGGGVRASVSSMFAVENVRSLFTASLGHAAPSSSASTS